MKRLLWLVMFVVMLTMTIATPVRAADGRSGDTLVIGANETVTQDLYVVANKIQIDGTLKGDLNALAQEIIVNGTIEGDLQGAAQTIQINGTTKEAVRVAAQTLTLGSESRVGDDLLALAYSLEMKPGSAVSGDALYAGYQGLLAGTINKRLQAGVVALELRGTINGDVQLALGESDGDVSPTIYMPKSPVALPRVASGLTIGESAKIGGKLSYQARRDAQVASGAQVTGGVTRTDPPMRTEQRRARPQPTALDATFDGVRHWVALILVGLLVLRFAPAWTRTLADTIQNKPLPSFGWGVVAVVAVMIGVLAIGTITVLLAIVFGIVSLGNLSGLSVLLGMFSLATLLIGFSVFTSYIAQIAVAYLGGRVVLERVMPAQANSNVAAFLVGATLLALVMAIPFLGGVIGLFVTLLGLGAFWLWFKTMRAPQTA